MMNPDGDDFRNTLDYGGTVHGWVGKILKVNLTKTQIVEEEFDLELGKKYLGGRGYGSRILYDDTLPKRLLEEPVKSGPSKGHVVRLEGMLREFYQFREWDENGVPIKEKLQELGLAQLSRAKEVKGHGERNLSRSDARI